jgi:hypothetical protein
MNICCTQQGKDTITTCKGFMVEACGFIARQHFSLSSFIKQADLLGNVCLYTNPEINISINIMSINKWNKFNPSSIVYSCEGQCRP